MKSYKFVWIYPKTEFKLAIVKNICEMTRTMVCSPDDPQWRKLCRDFEALVGRELLAGDIGYNFDCDFDFMEELKNIG